MLKHHSSRWPPKFSKKIKSLSLLWRQKYCPLSSQSYPSISRQFQLLQSLLLQTNTRVSCCRKSISNNLNKSFLELTLTVISTTSIISSSSINTSRSINRTSSCDHKHPSPSLLNYLQCTTKIKHQWCHPSKTNPRFYLTCLDSNSELSTKDSSLLKCLEAFNIQMAECKGAAIILVWDSPTVEVDAEI